MPPFRSSSSPPSAPESLLQRRRADRTLLLRSRNLRLFPAFFFSPFPFGIPFCAFWIEQKKTETRRADLRAGSRGRGKARGTSRVEELRTSFCKGCFGSYDHAH